jgi:hypothetical protein
MRERGLRAIVVAAASVALAASSPARADEGFALGRFSPSFAGDRLFGIQSPYAAGDNTFLAMVLLDYAHDPLVVRDTSGHAIGAVVSDQTLLHFHASYALFRVLTLDLDLPVGFQHGEQPMVMGLPTFAAPTSTALGDLRIGVRATMFGKPEDPFQIALSGLLWAPTGNRAAFTSDGGVRSQPMVVVGGAARWFVWSANVGPELRPQTTYAGITHGPAFRWGAGMGFLPGDGSFQVGPELTGGVGLVHPSKATTDFEALVGARARFAKRFVAGFAASLGLAPGVGTPDFRTVLSIEYAPLAHPKVVVADRDGDGILDAEDACPDVKGVRTTDPKTNGCPPPKPDRDGDGIPDDEDACPDVKGVPDPVRTLNGCPPDRDNDGIPDAEDACPDQIGPRDPDPKKNGCPVPEPPPPEPPKPDKKP